jgi:serine/threonine protein kinase
MGGLTKQQRILNQALATPVSDRSAFLDDACSGDEDLRKEIETKMAGRQAEPASQTSGGKTKNPDGAKTIPARLKQALKRDYELQDRLGGGGMCDLYLATHKSLGGKWAVKVLSERLAQDPKVVERFVTEAKIEANLQHPNIVKVVNIGETGDFHYFVMEYIEGQDLTRHLNAGALSEDKAAAIAIQICNALECAHDNNIIHRDLKPSNVRIDKYGSVYVLDFGIARARDIVQSSTSLNETLGTPLYMSPEQIRGAEVDQRSDLYSLGVILYEMLTGRNPFEGDNTHAVYARHFEFIPEPPIQLNPLISKTISDLTLRLLEKEPNKRFSNVKEVVGLLKSQNPTPLKQEPPSAETIEKPAEDSAIPPVEPVKDAPSSMHISKPRRPRMELKAREQVEASQHATPAADRLHGTNISAQKQTQNFQQFIATHKQWVVASIALLVVIAIIFYAAFRPSSVSTSTLEIDAAPYAVITIASPDGKLLNKSFTPAAIELSPGKYALTFEYEGIKRSRTLLIESGKIARIRENFWNERMDSEINTLLDKYFGKTQPPNRHP